MLTIDRFPLPPHADTQPPLGETPSIHPSCTIRNSQVGAWTELQAHTSLVESSFGDYSYTAGDVDIIYSDIGRFCSIASHVRINPGNHPMQRVTQHHMTYRRRQFGLGAHDDEAIFDWRRQYRCRVGHDVWIGHAAIIMPGVTIGHGAVVGAGSVVTKDVGAYQVVAGVPAKPLRLRFPQPVIERLLQIAWWDWDRSALERGFDELLDLQTFLDKHSPQV